MECRKDTHLLSLAVAGLNLCPLAPGRSRRLDHVGAVATAVRHRCRRASRRGGGTVWQGAAQLDHHSSGMAGELFVALVGRRNAA